MAKATTKTAAKPAAPKGKATTKPATEKVSNRTAKYAAGEGVGAAKPSKVVADALAKKAALDAAAKPATTRATDADKIVNIASATGPAGTKVLETAASKATGKGALAVLPNQLTAELRKLAVIGGSLKAVRAYIAEHKPEAKLAQGVSARVAPNAARASEQSRKPSKAAEPAPAPKPSKLGAKGQAQKPAPAPKAEKPARKPNVSTDGKRKSGQAYGGKVEPGMAIKVLASENPYKVGTKAHATFGLFAKSATVAKFRDLVAKNPEAYDAGYVRYAARDGFISLG